MLHVYNKWLLISDTDQNFKLIFKFYGIMFEKKLTITLSSVIVYPGPKWYYIWTGSYIYKYKWTPKDDSEETKNHTTHMSKCFIHLYQSTWSISETTNKDLYVSKTAVFRKIFN